MNKTIFRGKTKERWAPLGKDRLDVIAAKRDQLECEIQQAFNIIKEGAERQPREFKEINRH